MRISAGHTTHFSPTAFTREKGFPYWTIGVMLRGTYELGVPGSADAFSIMGPSLIGIRPGTPYRLSTPGGPSWAEHYMMFTPRADWLAWLDWPPIAPGIMQLKLVEASSRRSVLRAGQEVVEYFKSSQPEAESFAYNAMERFLLLAHTINPLAGPMRTDPRIGAALEHMSHHLAAPLTVETIAQAVGMSESNLAHQFRRQIGQSPMRYLESARIRRASHELLRTDRRISDIAREVGFENAFHFSTRFRKATGQCPRAFRHRPNPQSRAQSR